MTSFERFVLLGRRLGGLFVILALFTAVAVPNYRRAKMVYPGTRCFANQRKLASALEMFHLDMNKKIQFLNESTFERLTEGGYLEESLEDPGMGKDSWKHYQLTSKGFVFCTHHGFAPPLKGKGTSPKDQLKEVGETSEKLLAMASDKFHFRGKLGKNPIPFEPFDFFFAAIVVYLGFWILGFFVPRKKTLPMPTKDMFEDKS